jgi:hypothetical protein
LCSTTFCYDPNSEIEVAKKSKKAKRGAPVRKKQGMKKAKPAKRTKAKKRSRKPVPAPTPAPPTLGGMLASAEDVIQMTDAPADGYVA